jgi:predicted phage tail protein
MKNAQGQCEKDIMVNIMDVPTPPQNVKYSDVFQDNLMLNWSPPKDNGGTDIKKYIIEALDTTTGNGAWSEVAQTSSGTERSIKVEHLTPQHSYRFRVKAVNKVGNSDPGEMSGDDILMRDPWGNIIRTTLQI